MAKSSATDTNVGCGCGLGTLAITAVITILAYNSGHYIAAFLVAIIGISIAISIVWDAVFGDSNNKQKDNGQIVFQFETKPAAGAMPTRVTGGSHGSNSRYYNSLLEATDNLFDFIIELNRNKAVIVFLQSQDSLADSDCLKNFIINPRLGMLAWMDVMKCYNRLGYMVATFEKEYIALAIFSLYLFNDDARKYTKYEWLMRSKGIEVAREFITTSEKSLHVEGLEENQFSIIEVLKAGGFGDEMVKRYAVLLYRFASVLAKADGTVTEQESRWLSTIMSYANGREPGSNITITQSEDKRGSSSSNPRSSSARQKNNAAAKPQQPIDKDPLEQLNELVGLQEVKTDVNKLVNFIKVQQLRRQKGLRSTPVSYHCVFTGNPGTGKTTVARIMAGIYKNLGILSKGQLVETDRSGLVAEYVGQTAVKTNKIIDTALDGVLFIDEAYSLVQGSKEDYGKEAVATLLKRMEDDRDRLVVILAGYSEDMKQFIDTNPGLQSRFNRYIHFSDYSAADLMEIFRRNVRKYDYALSTEAEQKLTETLTNAVAHKDKNFGNARFVRNLLEKTIENQATRIASVGSITDEILKTILPQDLPK